MLKLLRGLVIFLSVIPSRPHLPIRVATSAQSGRTFLPILFMKPARLAIVYTGVFCYDLFQILKILGRIGHGRVGSR